MPRLVERPQTLPHRIHQRGSAIREEEALSTILSQAKDGIPQILYASGHTLV